MIDRGKHSVIGVMVDAVDYDAAVAKVIDAARSHQPFAVTALAVHGVMTGHQDEKHRCRLNAMDLVVPDGQPVRWALNLLHKTRLSDRVYGPDLTLKVLAEAERTGLPVYFYGSKPEVLDQLIARLRARYPRLRIAGSEPSKFRRISPEEKEAVVARIIGSGAKITFVGLGCPRQEVWAYEYRDDLSMPILAVGAAFDFHAGSLPQAPTWMQDRGLEWMYRLKSEPRRLWKRYVMLNPWYSWLVARQVLGAQFDVEPAADVDTLSFG